MRISIWSQFSSNHSGGFEIVGVFVSVEQAKAAEKELHDIFRTIADFREYEHTETDGALTWPEVEFSRRFSIPWSRHSIDWILPFGNGVMNVTRLDQHVFISNLDGDNTYLGHQPVDKLVEKLGGQALISGERSGINVIAFEVDCTAPNEDVANHIFNEINFHLADARAEKNILEAPWSAFITPVPLRYLTVEAYYGHIEKFGTVLHFRNLTFGASVGYAFPALIAYLQSHGCSNLHYTVEARDMNEVYEVGEQ